MPLTTSLPASPRWSPDTGAHRVRHLRRRYGLSEPMARLLAPLAYGEGRQ